MLQMFKEEESLQKEFQIISFKIPVREVYNYIWEERELQNFFILFNR